MKTDHIPLSRSLFDRIATQGLDARAILEQAALSPDLLTQPRATLATAEYFALWRAIGAASDDPAVGLRIGERRYRTSAMSRRWRHCIRPISTMRCTSLPATSG